MQETERPRSLLRSEIARLGEDRAYGTTTSGLLTSSSFGVFGRDGDGDDARRSYGLRASPPTGLPPRPDNEDSDRYRHRNERYSPTTQRVSRRSESGVWDGASLDRDRDNVSPSSSFPRRSRVGAAPSWDTETKRYVSPAGRVSEVRGTSAAAATTTRVRSPPDWQSGSGAEQRNNFRSTRYEKMDAAPAPASAYDPSVLYGSSRGGSLSSTRASLDAFATRRRAREAVAENDARARYDPNGIGVGVKAELNAAHRRAQLQSASSAPPRRVAMFDRPRGLRGLRNCGNTCFASACLQSLAHTPPLAEFLLRESSVGVVDGSPVSKVSKVASATRELVRKIHRSDSVTPSRDAVCPSTFLDALSTSGGPLDLFTDGDQHDSQEFLRFLLDSLDTDFTDVKVTPRYDEEKDDFTEPEPEKATRLWETYRKRTSSVVVDVFAGQLRSAVTCHACGKVSTSYDPFWDLSLPLRRRKGNETGADKNFPEPSPDKSKTRSTRTSASASLLSRYMGSTLGRSGSSLVRSSARELSSSSLSVADCLRAFGEDEPLLGTDAFHCPRCHKKGDATKTLSVQRPPRVLVLHLKRFQWTNGGRPGRKIDTAVEVPLVLHLRELLSGHRDGRESSGTGALTDPTYTLFSVINHTGSISHGHYTATTNVGADEWYDFNDERVSGAGAGPPSNSRNAYVLFYALKR